EPRAAEGEPLFVPDESPSRAGQGKSDPVPEQTQPQGEPVGDQLRVPTGARLPRRSEGFAQLLARSALSTVRAIRRIRPQILGPTFGGSAPRRTHDLSVDESRANNKVLPKDSVSPAKR